MTVLVPLLLGALLGGSSGGVEESRNWEDRYEFEPGSRPLITVDNIWGSVNISSHDRPYVEVRARETRAARDADMLEHSKQLLYLTQAHTPQGLTLAVDGIVRQSHHRNPCPGCRLALELELRVPADARIDAHTVMDGSVRVEGLGTVLAARNVNGDVSVSGVRHCETIKSVNGEVRVRFDAAPEHDSCRIETVNGDMTLAVPEATDATLEFDLFNGSVDSQLPVHAVPVASRVEQSSQGGARLYRVTRPMTVRLGDGGPRFTFESINGDVHIEKY